MTEQQRQYNAFFPDSFTLETPVALLRPMVPEDVDAFLPLTADKQIWTYFTKDLSNEEELKSWVEEALRGRKDSIRMPFTVIDKDAKTVSGSTSYGNISFYDRRLEIGWTWLGSSFMGTGLNRHAKFALLSFAFEAMKMERVEVKTDNLNERAKAALVKIGMYPEGVLRSHMQMFNDRRRDSIYYSIIKSEWEQVKQYYFSDLA